MNRSFYSPTDARNPVRIGPRRLLVLSLLAILLLGGCAVDASSVFAGTTVLAAPATALDAPGQPVTQTVSADIPAGPSVDSGGDAQSANQVPAAPGVVQAGLALAQVREITPTVTIRNRRVNIRSGPGTNFSVVTVVEQGTVLDIAGSNENQSWWQICCVTAGEETGQSGWVANSVVTVQGNGQETPVTGALFTPEDTAAWTVTYACESERCAVQQCTGGMHINASKLIQRRWMEFDRSVEWEAGCGENTYWLHQIDNNSGEERYPPEIDSPLFRYWIGALPGDANALFFLSERPIHVYCSGPYTYETDEGEGWTTVYTGNTCHDVRTGTLISMAYERRWLFSGEFDGKSYTNEFFGDRELYELQLAETTIGLAYLSE